MNGGRQPAGLKAADGKLWFPTMGGVAVIDPRTVRTSATPPPAIIEEFRLSGKPVDFAQQVRIPPDAATLRNPLYRAKLRQPGAGQVPLPAGRARQRLDRRRRPAIRQLLPHPVRTLPVRGQAQRVMTASGAPPVHRRYPGPGAILADAVVHGAGADRSGSDRLRRTPHAHAAPAAAARAAGNVLRPVDRVPGRRAAAASPRKCTTRSARACCSSAAERPHGRRPARRSDGAAGGPISSLAGKADDEMKEIAYDLRPYQLDKIGCLADHRGHGAADQRARAASTIDTDIDDIDDLLCPSDAAIHVFRIVQEASTTSSGTRRDPGAE